MPVPPSVIIGIHGLANKPPSVDKPGYWKKALIEGLKRNCGKTTNDLSFDFVYWADLRYPTPIAYSDNPEYYYEDPGVGPFPDYHTKKWAEIINTATEIAGTEVNFLDVHTGVTKVGEFVLERELQDLAAYYADVEFRETVRGRLTDKLKLYRGSRIMLIGHSMGSIIAYDVLRLLGRNDPQFSVDHFGADRLSARHAARKISDFARKRFGTHPDHRRTMDKFRRPARRRRDRG